MRKLAIALTLASSLAMPTTAVLGQESSSDSEYSGQQQQQQQAQQRDSREQRRESQQQQRESQAQQSESQRQSGQSGSSSSSQSSQQQSQQRQRQQAQERQAQQESQRRQSQSQSEAQTQRSRSPRNVLLQGTIVDMDTIDLQGHGYQHVFVTVRSDHSGRTFLVDLGTRSELQRLSIEPGQKVAITGQMGPFRDTQLIVAHEAQQGDRSASVRRGQGEAWSQFTQQQQQQMQDCPLCAAKASNQQQQARQQQQRSRSNQTAQSQQQSQRRQSISGTLVDARSIQLRGQQERHVLAKIETDEGRTIIADLGPRRNLREFQPTRGSEIEVSGTRGTINGRPVLMANRASAGDQSVNIQRSGSQDARQTRQSQQSQQQRRQQQQPSQQTAQLQQGQRGAVQGRLVSTVAMDFGARSPTFVLGTLETQDGQRVLVDLGTLQDIQDAQLRLGEELRASGRVTQLNGVPVVIARQIEDDGQTITIARQSPDVEQTVRSSAGSIRGDGDSSSSELQRP